MTKDERIAQLLHALAEEFEGESPAPMEPEDVLLTVDEAAARMRVSRAWLYRNAARLAFTVRTGRMVRVSKRGLEAYLRERTAARGPHVA